MPRAKGSKPIKVHRSIAVNVGAWLRRSFVEPFNLTIEETASRSVDTMKAIATTIIRLSDLANEVAVSVRQQDSVTQEIARNAGAAAKGTREVSVNISEVSGTAVKAGHVANAVLAAAGELAEQSLLLRREVEQYLTQVRVA